MKNEKRWLQERTETNLCGKTVKTENLSRKTVKGTINNLKKV